MEKEITIKQNLVLPALAMRDLVIFPKMVMHFDVARLKSIKAIKTALEGDRRIFLVSQKA